MIKHVLAAVISASLISAVPLTSAMSPALAAAAKPEDTKKAEEKKPAKKLTEQQQKMKDCSVKWNEEKKAKKVSGKTAHNKFMSTCLKG